MESSRLALIATRPPNKRWRRKIPHKKLPPPPPSPSESYDSPTKKATTPTKKATPSKKATPTKKLVEVTITPTKKASPTKNATSTKSVSKWIVPPSPRSLEFLYKTLREDHNNLKVEIMEFFHRMTSFADDEIMKDLLLESYPLTKLYDSFLTMGKHGEEGGTSNLVPLIIIPDSSTSNI